MFILLAYECYSLSANAVTYKGLVFQTNWKLITHLVELFITRTCSKESCISGNNDHTAFDSLEPAHKCHLLYVKCLFLHAVQKHNRKTFLIRKLIFYSVSFEGQGFVVSGCG